MDPLPTRGATRAAPSPGSLGSNDIFSIRTGHPGNYLGNYPGSYRGRPDDAGDSSMSRTIASPGATGYTTR